MGTVWMNITKDTESVIEEVVMSLFALWEMHNKQASFAVFHFQRNEAWS